MKQGHNRDAPSLARPRPRYWRRLLLLGFLCLLLLGASLAAWRAISIQQGLRRGADELNRAISVLTGKPPLEISNADLDAADLHLKAAEETLGPVRDELALWSPLLTLAGGDPAAALPLADLALHTARAGHELRGSLRPLVTWLDNVKAGAAPGESALTELIALLREARPGLSRAREEIKIALRAYDLIDRGSLSGEVAGMVTKAARYVPRLVEARDAVGTLIESPELLTSLVGADRQKTYLVLAQNNDELRPTGGFISTFGLLVVRDGKLVAHEFASTLSPLLSPPTEPCPDRNPDWWIRLERPVWACWDAQWTADFPTLARQAKWFYDHGANGYRPVDGVIALDETGMEILLNALGPVSVPEYGEVITGSNFRDRTYFYRKKGSTVGDGQMHKEFLGGVFQAAVQQHLSRLPADRAPDLIKALGAAISGKHLLLYFEDTALQGMAARVGADGSILPTPDGGDYLHVVDTSLQQKVFGSIQQEVAYNAAIGADDVITSRVTVTWTYPLDALQRDPAIANAVHPDRALPWLLNLTRIYIPGKSRWLSMSEGSPGYFDSEAGKLVVGTRVDVHAGETGRVSYNYQVPAGVRRDGKNRVYTLLVQKQPGTKAFPLRVRVTLPQGTSLVSAPPGATEAPGAYGGVVSFNDTLAADRTFTLVFR